MQPCFCRIFHTCRNVKRDLGYLARVFPPALHLLHHDRSHQFVWRAKLRWMYLSSIVNLIGGSNELRYHTRYSVPRRIVSDLGGV